MVSAKFGLLDITDEVPEYDEVMTPGRAAEHRASVSSGLRSLERVRGAMVNLGKAYRGAVEPGLLEDLTPRLRHAGGGIGQKMRGMKEWLRDLPRGMAGVPGVGAAAPYLYFFPDWDDHVPIPFDGNRVGRLSGERRYAHELFGDRTPYDGLLVSLAQTRTGKGALAKGRGGVGGSIRERMRIPERLVTLGDCGAFSYVGEDRPPFTPAQAAALYEKFGFDLGASVDHIPLPAPEGDRRGGHDPNEVARRIELTTTNAEKFKGLHGRRGYRFTPLGVVQGVDAACYAESVRRYVEMGYRHIALGGLVPRTDGSIAEICFAVRRALQEVTRTRGGNVWVHLFGILRPNLQPLFRSLGFASFDSASFLRKAWLRSNQNYLSPGGSGWYSTIRIPISTSKAMIEGAQAAGVTGERLAEMERRCLDGVRAFNGSPDSAEEVLSAVGEYEPLLKRRGGDAGSRAAHEVLLRDRPWERCECAACREIGTEIVVFRGTGRNKRRGFHNTWVFYHKMLHGSSSRGAWE